MQCMKIPHRFIMRLRKYVLKHFISCQVLKVRHYWRYLYRKPDHGNLSSKWILNYFDISCQKSSQILKCQCISNFCKSWAGLKRSSWYPSLHHTQLYAYSEFNWLILSIAVCPRETCVSQNAARGAITSILWVKCIKTKQKTNKRTKNNNTCSWDLSLQFKFSRRMKHRYTDPNQ